MQSTVSKFKDENIIKIAVQFKNYPAQLIEFDQRQSLSAIVQRLCSFPGWNCSPPFVTYALQYFESNCKNYVTEENRAFVKNGSILLLTYSALKSASDIIRMLKTGSLPTIFDNLKKLMYAAKDLAFAVEFIKMNGLDLLIQFINSGNVTGEMLKYVLISFAELMGHEIVLWKTVESLIIGRIIYFLDHEKNIIECILDVLDSLIRNNSDPQSIINIKFDSLLLILEQSACDEAVKQKIISLINSLFQAANEEQKIKIADAFRTKKYRDVINTSVMKMESMPNELNYQLYVFQTLVLSLIGKRMRTLFSENDDSAINSIRVLKQIAFGENESERSRTDSIRLRKSQSKMRDSLGFDSNVTIEQSFSVAPPGVLPLDCLQYFAENYSTVYKIMIFNLNQTVNDNYGFPLGEVAIELVKLLCNLFKIGEPPCEQTGKFHPIFFAHEHPFFELFCVCMEVLHRNWKEMRASRHDFINVFSVTEDQILRTLNVLPLNFREFRRTIKTFPYSRINMFRELERAANEEYESTVPVVVNLTRKLTPKIKDLIKKQRLEFLTTGSRFYEYTKSGQRIKNQIWYARLSVNHKTLHYGHCDEESIPTVDELHKQISVKNMKGLLVGKECPGYHKHQSLQPCATPLEFIAPDEVTQNYWVDGLRSLLNLETSSTRYNEDIDTLLAMEIKLRLLDTTGVGINKDTPPIPPDPEDYNF